MERMAVEDILSDDDISESDSMDGGETTSDDEDTAVGSLVG